MLISLEWLSDFVDIDCTPEELQDRLVKAGFEIEEIIKQGDNCKNVVVGRIEKIDKHPDADKLQICQIDIGSERVQIVTGADNIKVGDYIPVAKDNSYLPNGMHIKKGKLRGVMSCGMLCSGEELMLKESDYKGAEVNGILILNGDLKVGSDINDIIGNNDTILDIGITANRADCNSVIGIAREVAAVLGKPLKKEFKTSLVVSETIDNRLTVKISEPEICSHYMAALVTDVVIKESPEFIKRRLKSVGLRPINNIVDITNYVLIECGQPMHAFDYACLDDGAINVRKAVKGEKIIALDKKEYELDGSELVIADNNKPCAIAGVMGGLLSGISEKTKTIVFESARFARESIRRTSRKLNLRSDSSIRYERGIDYESQLIGLQRSLELITQTQSGKIADVIIDASVKQPVNNIVDCKVSKINEILGIDIPESKIVEILNSLNIKTEADNGNLHCIAPLYREDIENVNDLSEEVIRLFGYDNIKCTLPSTKSINLPNNKDNRHLNEVKNILVGEGMNEILTYSFGSPKDFDLLCLKQDSLLRNAIILKNPLGEDFSVMRTTLIAGMLEVIAKNINRGNKELRLFEFARVYLPKELPLIELPLEINKISMGITGKKEDFYTIKGIVQNLIDYCGVKADFARSDREYLHPGISADIIINDINVGYFGEVHPNVLEKFDIKDNVFVAEINYDALIALYKDEYKFMPIPKFPVVERDLAVIVDESVSARDILNTVNNAGGKMLMSSEIFDVYRGKGIEQGKKSVAVSMKFGVADRTLVDDEINAKIDKIIKKLEGQLGAALR